MVSGFCRGMILNTILSAARQQEIKSRLFFLFTFNIKSRRVSLAAVLGMLSWKATAPKKINGACSPVIVAGSKGVQMTVSGKCASRAGSKITKLVKTSALPKSSLPTRPPPSPLPLRMQTLKPSSGFPGSLPRLSPAPSPSIQSLPRAQAYNSSPALLQRLFSGPPLVPNTQASSPAGGPGCFEESSRWLSLCGIVCHWLKVGQSPPPVSLT